MSLEQKVQGHLTEYGFTWGPSEVTRIGQINNHTVIQLRAGKTKLEIYVSPTGRSVRVFKNHKELLPAALSPAPKGNQ